MRQDALTWRATLLGDAAPTCSPVTVFTKYDESSISMSSCINIVLDIPRGCISHRHATSSIVRSRGGCRTMSRPVMLQHTHIYLMKSDARLQPSCSCAAAQVACRVQRASAGQRMSGRRCDPMRGRCDGATLAGAQGRWHAWRGERTLKGHGDPRRGGAM